MLVRDDGLKVRELSRIVVTLTLAATETGALQEGPLTARELEVLEQLVLGLNDRQIALALHLSTDTIKYHLKQIYQKLGVHNRTSAALLVVLAGWIDPPASLPLVPPLRRVGVQLSRYCCCVS